MDSAADKFDHRAEVENLESATSKPDRLQDVAADVANSHPLRTFSPKEQARLLRRIDLVLMPLMFISFGLQYLDKALLSNAAQFGIIQDLGLSDVEIVQGQQKTSLTKFSYATLIFYWGYLAGCFPATYLAQRLPIGKYAGVSIAIWGIITMSTAGVKSYPGFMVQRFFLGVCEAAVSPAFSLITAMWYKANEQPLRIAIWYAATGFGSLFGSIASWGIGHITGYLHPWQYQYLILGTITVVWGLIVICFLPDNPIRARFLSPDDKILAVERMRAGQTGIENSVFKLYQVKEALLDIKTWFFVVMTFCIHMINGAVSGFGSVIVSSFGFNQFESVLLTGVVGAVVFLSLIAAGIFSVYVPNQRCNLMVIASLPVIAGSAMIYKASWTSHAAPLAGFYLLGFFPIPYVMLLAVMAANTAGHTKKAVTAGLVWATYCISNGVAPLLVKTTEVSAHYPTLFEPLLALTGLNVILAIGLRWYLQRDNRRRTGRHLVEESDASRTAFADMTDKENPNFRHSW